MNNDFGSGLTRVRCGRIRRSVVDDQDMVQLLERTPDNVGNVFFLQVSRYDRRDRCAVDRAVRLKLS